MVHEIRQESCSSCSASRHHGQCRSGQCEAEGWPRTLEEHSVQEHSFHLKQDSAENERKREDDLYTMPLKTGIQIHSIFRSRNAANSTLLPIGWDGRNDHPTLLSEMLSVQQPQTWIQRRILSIHLYDDNRGDPSPEPGKWTPGCVVEEVQSLTASVLPSVPPSSVAELSTGVRALSTSVKPDTMSSSFDTVRLTSGRTATLVFEAFSPASKWAALVATGSSFLSVSTSSLKRLVSYTLSISTKTLPCNVRTYRQLDKAEESFLQVCLVGRGSWNSWGSHLRSMQCLISEARHWMDSKDHIADVKHCRIGHNSLDIQELVFINSPASAASRPQFHADTGPLWCMRTWGLQHLALHTGLAVPLERQVLPLVPTRWSPVPQWAEEKMPSSDVLGEWTRNWLVWLFQVIKLTVLLRWGIAKRMSLYTHQHCHPSVLSDRENLENVLSILPSFNFSE